MRALPPLTLTLTNHRNWNAAVRGLATLAGGAMIAWALGWAPALGGVHLAGLAAAIVAIVLLARGACLGGAVRLQWDGQGWQVGDPPRVADCRLALDLGGWMLLRCRTAEAVIWLPLQRAGLGADWHALRCAVHAARPAAVRLGSGDPARPIA